MVGAKAAGHHGVPETNPSPDTSSKKLSSAARRSTVQFYVRQRKKKGHVRTRVKLVPYYENSIAKYHIMVAHKIFETKAL
jgi:hypothetical protein